jgi:phosphate transport system substrate-binding protein
MRLHPLFLALLMLATTAGLGAEETVINFRGSLSVAPIVAAGGKAYREAHPDITFKLSDSSTPASLKAIAAGEADLGATARELKPDERTTYPDLHLTLLCYDGVVIVVNKAFPLDAITTQQFQDIWTGTTNDLKQLGGAGGPLSPIGRPETQATQELVHQVLGLEVKPGMTPDGSKGLSCKAKTGKDFGPVIVTIASSHKDAAAKVLANPGAISYLSLGMAQGLIAKGQPLKILPLDGHVPSEASILDGSYPLHRKLFLLTNGAPKGAVADFIAFLTGPTGQGIVKRLEFIPAPTP